MALDSQLHYKLQKSLRVQWDGSVEVFTEQLDQFSSDTPNVLTSWSEIQIRSDSGVRDVKW